MLHNFIKIFTSRANNLLLFYVSPTFWLCQQRSSKKKALWSKRVYFFHASQLSLYQSRDFRSIFAQRIQFHLAVITNEQSQGKNTFDTWTKSLSKQQKCGQKRAGNYQHSTFVIVHPTSKRLLNFTPSLFIFLHEYLISWGS